MRPDAAVGLIESLGKILVPFGGTALLAALIYVLWRTGSGHLLRRRLWRFVYGKEAVSDEVVRGFIEDRTSLMAFRYNAGLSARTLEQARRLAAWLKENDEDIATVRAVGHYFDRERLQMKPDLPRKSKLYWWLAGLAAIWLVTLMVGGAWFSERGYFSMKKSGLWFSASESDVKGVNLLFRQERPQLTPELCRQAPPANGGFSEDDAAILCRLLLDPEAKSYVAQAVKEQRVLLGVVVVVFGGLFARVLMKMRQAGLAWEMERRLRVRSVQAPLAF